MRPDFSAALVILRREIPDLQGVYLFGSFASGHARHDSDVDLAVLAGSAIARARLLDIQEHVARALLRDVDLVDLREASTILQAQVLATGQLLDAPDPKSVALFEVRLMREYQDLKARRAPLEADIVQRGRVHA